MHPRRKRYARKPLTAAQQKLVAEVAAQDLPRFVRFKHKPLYRACLANGMTDDDIQQAALVGVVRAAQKFDPTRGFKFFTYAAYWVRSALEHECRRLNLRLGKIISGDVMVQTSASFTPQPRWERLALAAPEEPDGALRELIAHEFATLPARDRQVLELRYGFDGRGYKTLDEVGELMGISKERVRQIELRAFRRIEVPLLLQI